MQNNNDDAIREGGSVEDKHNSVENLRFLTLGTGEPRTSRRYALAGDNIDQKLADAIRQINDLPSGLSFQQLQDEALKIFKSLGLQRVEP
jgi:hypothetical protein